MDERNNKKKFIHSKMNNYKNKFIFKSFISFLKQENVYEDFFANFYGFQESRSKKITFETYVIQDIKAHRGRNLITNAFLWNHSKWGRLSNKWKYLLKHNYYVE